MARLESPDEGPYLPIGSRFCDLRPLGYGSGGMVFSAVDGECEKSVAIKRISLGDKKTCRSALREIRILRKLEHENIVKIYDVIFGGSSDNCDEEEEKVTLPSELRTLCIVQELVDTDLRRVLEQQRLGTEHVRLFAYQLLRGLKYLHSANVLHRDLKPENVLINQEDLVLKIGDFGMARILDPDYSHKGYLTQNVSTQWYRSPELVLQPTNYTKAIDLWSAGCIIAEMVMGKPVFPADHDLELMMLVLDSIQLDDRDLNEILCTLPSKLLKNYNGYPRHPLTDVLSNLDNPALDLLLAMLTFDPSERITAEEALHLPYFKMYSCLVDEPSAKNPFHIECEVDDLPPITIKKLILEECKERTDMEMLFSLESDTGFEGDDENVRDTGVLSRTSSEERTDSLMKDEEGMKETCVDNAFLHRMVSLGNKESESSEKNESEESEKSDDEEKEFKMEEFKEAMRKSSNNTDQFAERDGDAVEKGSVESDSEGSEKSESEDLVSEKGMNNQGENVHRGSKEDLLEEKFEEWNKGENNKEDEKMEDGAMSKAELKESLLDLDMDVVEKAFGDKLQKEKLNEQLSNRETEDSSVRKKQTSENKELHLTEDLEILKEERRSKEKTLEGCLDLGSLKLTEDPPSRKNVDVVLDTQLPEQEEEETSSEGIQNFKDKSQFVELMGTDNASMQELQRTMCNTQVDEREQPKRPDLKEVLYVDIPKASASTSPRSSPRGLVKESGRRNSLSPRERSVRPKKKDWYYTKH